MSGLKGSFDVLSKSMFPRISSTPVDNSDEAKLFQFSATMDRKVLKTEGTSCRGFHLIRFNRDGIYGVLSFNLFSYLVLRVTGPSHQPSADSNYVKMQLRKTKTDKKDAVVIAQFLLTNGATLVQRATRLDFGSSGSFRQRESLVDEMTSLKMRLSSS